MQLWWHLNLVTKMFSFLTGFAFTSYGVYGALSSLKIKSHIVNHDPSVSAERLHLATKFCHNPQISQPALRASVLSSTLTGMGVNHSILMRYRDGNIHIEMNAGEYTEAVKEELTRSYVPGTTMDVPYDYIIDPTKFEKRNIVESIDYPFMATYIGMAVVGMGLMLHDLQ